MFFLLIIPVLAFGDSPLAQCENICSVNSCFGMPPSTWGQCVQNCVQQRIDCVNTTIQGQVANATAWEDWLQNRTQSLCDAIKNRTQNWINNLPAWNASSTQIQANCYGFVSAPISFLVLHSYLLHADCAQTIRRYSRASKMQPVIRRVRQSRRSTLSGAFSKQSVRCCEI